MERQKYGFCLRGKKEMGGEREDNNHRNWNNLKCEKDKIQNLILYCFQPMHMPWQKCFCKSFMCWKIQCGGEPNYLLTHVEFSIMKKGKSEMSKCFILALPKWNMWE